MVQTRDRTSSGAFNEAIANNELASVCQKEVFRNPASPMQALGVDSSADRLAVCLIITALPRPAPVDSLALPCPPDPSLELQCVVRKLQSGRSLLPHEGSQGGSCSRGSNRRVPAAQAGMASNHHRSVPSVFSRS